MRSLGTKVRNWWKTDELDITAKKQQKQKNKLLKKVEQQCNIIQPQEYDTEYTIGKITPTLSGRGVSVNVILTPKDTMERKIQLIHEKEEAKNPFILNQNMIQQIAVNGLPSPINYFSKWRRVYSLSRDGDSFNTFLRLCKNENRTIVVVQCTKGTIFGGFVDSRWNPNDGFYGSAQAFLFKLEQDKIISYKWTGLNRYIQFCDSANKVIAMGGGGGSFGLCIEDDFRRGSTGRCETFGNDPLCLDDQFDVLELECWSFVSCALE